MKLCIGIITDILDKPIIYKSYSNFDNEFSLERCEIYCGQPVLKKGTIYISQADTLPDIVSVQIGSAMVCIGMPTEVYTKSPLRLTVLSGDCKLEDLINHVTAIFSEYNNLEYKLLEAVSRGMDIQYLVDLMAPYFNQNELFVNSREFKFIGRSNPRCRLCEISNIAQPNPEILPEEVVTFFKNDIIYKNVRDLTEPFIYEPSVFSKSSLCMNVFYGGEYTCRVVVSDDRNPYRDYDVGLLRFFTSYIQLIFNMSKQQINVLSKDHTVDVFAELLRGEHIDRRRLEDSITQRKWDKSGPFLCAYIMPSDRDFYNRTIPFYCQTFNREFKGCCLFEFQGAIVCVASLTFYDSSAWNFSSRYLETFRDANFRVGYSNVFSDIMQLQSYYLQSVIALRVGLERYPSIWQQKFSDNIFNYLQSKMTEELDGSFLCAPEILILQRYDKENNSDYLRTLKIYLDNEMNTLKTAKDLFVHRTTMEYRLNRMKELAGIDFNNADSILYLRMSIKFFVNIE